MSNEYLDIDSSYRNRNLWPIPGQFEIPISQTGDKGKGYALDPVCLSEPVAVWSCNGLTTSQPSTFQLYGVISPPQTYGNVGYSQNGVNMSLIFNNLYNNSVQITDDYYVGLVFWNVTKNSFARVTSYRYIGNDGMIPPQYSIALITIDSELSFNFNDNFCITDPSDLTNSNYPLLFVPNGKTEDNGYLNYILYCETNNDYRAVTLYDSIYKYISCKPWTDISNPTFQQYGNFCIRKEPPVFPEQLEQSQFVSTDSNNSIVKVTISGSCSLSQTTNFYEYDFLRIRPYRTINNPVTVVIGGQNLSGDTGDIMAYGVNGINWTENPNPLDIQVNDIANNSPNISTIWVAVGSSTLPVTITYSNDGKNWYPSQNPFASIGRSVFYFGGYWFAGSRSTNSTDKSFAVSIDGITWPNTYRWNPFGTPYSSSGSGSGGIVNGISVSGTEDPNIYTIIVVGKHQTDASVGTIMKGIFDKTTEPPTITWYQTDNNFFAEGLKVAYNNTVWVMVGISLSPNLIPSITYSDQTGLLWFVANIIPTSGLIFENGIGRGISWNGSYWLAVGNNSDLTTTIAVSYSKSGAFWSKCEQNPFDGTGVGFDIIWSNSYWIAVGGPLTTTVATTTVIATSTNGINWNQITTYADLFICRTISVYNSNNFENIGIYNQNLTSQSRQIISYTNDGATAIFNVYPPFSGTDLFATDNSYTIEVEAFSYDNCNPFTYIGTLVQQQSCYEFELIDLILPNFTLSSGKGSKIAFYPYVYVILSNVSSSGSHLKNILSSNNPNAVNVIFKVPIYDVQDPFSTPFVRLISGSMIQTIKFKPNDNLFFSVLLPNGDIFNTLLPEAYSPEIPTAKSQISATFRFKRI